MIDRVLLADGLIDLRLGRWQDCLADVETCAAILCDPPEGRRCITSEMDPVTFEKARRRLERGFTPSMFQRGPKVKAKQGGLL